VLGLIHILRRADTSRFVGRGARAGDIQQIDRRAQPAGKRGGRGEQRGRGRCAVERQQQALQRRPRLDSHRRHFRADEQNRLSRAGDYLLGHATQAAPRFNNVAMRRQHN